MTFVLENKIVKKDLPSLGLDILGLDIMGLPKLGNILHKSSNLKERFSELKNNLGNDVYKLTDVNEAYLKD